MIKILPLGKKVQKLIGKHHLSKKIDKQLQILSSNPRHPSLNVELLEPKHYGLYSFRIDRKYRGIFIFRLETGEIEVITVTVHYR